jgi:Tol biopolymer transport system component
MTIPVTGGTPTQLTTGSNVSDRFPNWSPDGVNIIFERKVSGGPTNLYQVPAAGGTPTEYYTAASSDTDAAVPSFSPDGRIAIAATGHYVSHATAIYQSASSGPSAG